MTTERSSETGGNAREGVERAIEDAVALWIDRLLSGEELDPLEVLALHPGIGHEVIDRLESFVGVGLEEATPLKRLGDFHLIRKLGRGGMGVVYEAQQVSMNRRVALKILPAGIAADRTAFLRFMREAQTAGRLRHPAIVGVHSLGIESDTPYYAMEHIDGVTLAQIVSKRRDGKPVAEGGAFAPEDKDQGYYIAVAKAFAQVADGLHHAHREGVVHRDIKPSNLMLDSAGRLRILDFGLAYFEDSDTLTLTGEVVGTPLYMSPEQARREVIPVGHRTDVYSLGATLYEVLTLCPPFRGKDRLDILRQIIENDPPPLRTQDPLAPPDLETIVSKCMRKHPDRRYNTAEALSQDLSRFVKGEPIEARPESSWAQLVRRVRRHRSRLIAAAVLLAACVAVTWLAFSRSRAEHARELALYPGRLREAVGKLDSGTMVFRHGSRPLSVPGIDFRIFEPDDFRDVVELAGKDTISDAITELRELARVCPEQPETRYHLGRAYAVTGQSRLALSELERALQVDPTFIAADVLRRRILDLPMADVYPNTWIALQRRADIHRWRREHSQAEQVLTQLIREFEESEPPYTGFLTECYLDRAKVRLALKQYDLAEEDCVRARARNPASLASELILGKVYLSARKPDMAHRTFARLKSRFEILDVLPFWVASVYLSVPESDLARALDWARGLRNEVLRERLMTYLYFRLANWDAAAAAAQRAVEADPEELVHRQLLADALIKKVILGDKNNAIPILELALAIRVALEHDPQDRRSRYLVRAGWESLRSPFGWFGDKNEALKEARSVVLAAAKAVDVTLPFDIQSWEITDDFVADSDISDGRPLRWRVIDECCPGRVESTSSGLQVTKDPERRYDAWLVTDEVFSGDVTVVVRADPGQARVSSNIHVDLGTASLYYAGVSRDGHCDLGRLDYTERTSEVTGNVGAIEGDVFLELRSRGETIEARVWPEGAERPEEPTLQMPGTALMLGSIAISTNAHPASFRWVKCIANHR